MRQMEVGISTNGYLSARFSNADRVEMRSDYVCISEEDGEFESTLPFDEVTVTIKYQGTLGIHFGGSALAVQGTLQLKLFNGHVLCEGSSFRLWASRLVVMISEEDEDGAM